MGFDWARILRTPQSVFNVAEITAVTIKRGRNDPTFLSMMACKLSDSAPIGACDTQCKLGAVKRRLCVAHGG